MIPLSRYVRTLEDYKKAMAYRMTEKEIAFATVDLEIGNAIRKTREIKHLSQRELAAMVGVAPAQINRWESGKQNFTVHSLVRIASIIGCDFVCPLRPPKDDCVEEKQERSVNNAITCCAE